MLCIRRGIRQGCDTALAANLPAQVLCAAVQALLPARRAEGRHGNALAARRLAHAVRRISAAVAGGSGKTGIINKTDIKVSGHFCPDIFLPNFI